MDLAKLVAARLVGKETAELINEELNKRGLPTENRIVILTPKDLEGKTSSGIIIPVEATGDAPRKGVIVQKGFISEDNKEVDHDLLKVGNLATYGLYAGKELELLDELDLAQFKSDKHELRVISVNEIIYVEHSYK